MMKKLSDGTYVVNTTTLANDVDGYQGTTHVEILCLMSFLCYVLSAHLRFRLLHRHACAHHFAVDGRVFAVLQKDRLDVTANGAGGTTE